jgi:4-amino-4-deoxy-L-arabinose transferase-like glycosyltransferase
VTTFDRLSLFAVVTMAALLRIPGIDARGQFDADQGHDMSTLVAFTRDGVVPLLGPRTSVGEFHHGAFYYYLLAPSAAVSGGDPVVVTLFIALLGIAAVALTWWLGRSIGGRVAGPVAGLVAGTLLAVSPGAIEESTFIWNPNPIAFFAVLSVAAAWKSWRSGRSGWWALAIAAAGAVTQLHVLGLVFLLAMLGIGLIELRRDRSVAAGLLTGLLLVGLQFLPLLLYELQSGFQETRAVLAYLSSDTGALGDPVGALALTLLRVVGWPLVGLVTDVPQLAGVMLAVTVGVVILGVRMAGGAEATGLRWLIGILVFSTIALAFVAPSLQRVVPGLPNDHYHAFLDPIVVLLLAIPAGHAFSRAAATWRERRQPMALAAMLIVGVGIAALELTALSRKPPHVDPQGGWPAARAAGERVVGVVERIAPIVGGRTILLIGLPDFKLTDGIGYPIEYAGGQVRFLVDLDRNPKLDVTMVVVCDRLFEGPIGLPCGGPAEDALVADLSELYPDHVGMPPVLLDRFDVSPGGRTSVSIYP